MRFKKKIKMEKGFFFFPMYICPKSLRKKLGVFFCGFNIFNYQREKTLTGEDEIFE